MAAEPVDLIFYNKVMDRIAIRQLISRFIFHFGITYTTHVLDQLKTLGFEQATYSAISLGIDDLLTASSKTWLIEDAEQYGNLSQKHQNFGNLHAVEKLRQLVETWYATSEYLKQEMNPNFRMTDPLNPVYMMSFSGARGSASQVHQLVGMRGLMSDPQGQIIDLPIQSNFREGLSLTEYIISCYGARKGIVDTAVRTSDAGYLTRRLVEVVQRIVVRKIDCETIYGIFIKNTPGKKLFQQKVIGRVLAENIYINNRCFVTRNQDIGVSLANRLSILNTKIISVRSPLTCKSMLWICQSCYGWSLTNSQLVEIGEAVGIIAGQSIGEPGTQLTLRTFHTGGVFTGDIAKHIRAPSNGIIKFDESLIYPTRTRHGHPAWICYTNLFINIQNRNEKNTIIIPPKSLLLIQNNQYVESKQVIAETRAKTLPFKEKIQRYIYSKLEGEMSWNKKVCHASEYIHSNIHSILRTCHIWILSGQFYNKIKKLLVLFYENQDKINYHIILAKKKSLIFFPKNKSQVNFWILNSWVFGINKIIKKSKLTHTMFHYLNNPIKSTFILYGYNIIKKYRNLFLQKRYALSSILKIRKNSFLNNGNIFAILDSPKYELKKSGILKYGTIQINLINRNNDFEDTSTTIQPKYRIIKGGNFFFIDEKLYIYTKSLSLLLVKNNEFVQKGTFITSSIMSDISGLIKIRRRINNTYEIKILPGTIYYPNNIYEISKQMNILIPPGKKIFNKIQCNRWTYLQWIMPSKKKPFALMRPAIKYEISNKSNNTNLLNLLRKNTYLKLKSINYIFYEDGEQIQIINKNNLQLIRIFLIIHWKGKYFLEKAHISFLKIKIKNSLRIFVQINLMNFLSPYSNKKQTVLNSQYVLKKTHYKTLFLMRTNKIRSKSQGIIRFFCTENEKKGTFVVLSPFDLVRIFKINKSRYFNLEKNSNSFFSTKFFDFCKYPKNSNFLNKSDQVNRNLLPSKNKFFESSSFDQLGLIGNLQNIKNFFECFFLLTYSKMVIKNLSKIDKYPKWYFIDEYEKIYRFIFKIKFEIKLFTLFLSLIPSTETTQNVSLGNFFIDNFYISKFLDSLPSSQIIGIQINYLIIRLAKPYLVTEGAIIHNNYGEFVKQGDALITLIYERLKSGDIIQGLPKIEQLLEARQKNWISTNLDNNFENWNNDIKKFIGNLWGFFLSAKVNTKKGQIILVDQIQKVYQSQGVYVSNKHIEIIVRQMTSKVVTLEDGIINIFLPGELIESSRAQRMNRILENANFYESTLLGITKSSLNTQSFISESSFQETTRVLAKAALKGRTDWLKGLKENVILGRIIPAGTGSQEVIWQLTFEKEKEKFFYKNNNLKKKKIRNIFLYKNRFTIFPIIQTFHNKLKR
uniref:DNA-directed RNA polymerase subunit beta'' n=1 Tax=Radula japonica TaxID=1068553 RepID=A0A4Y5P5S0_9MARC|nr:RNA polymerase beta' subunit [Radula japonica]QCW58654.1 RNA polymerase beta' subunit [Radula japonica]